MPSPPDHQRPRAFDELPEFFARHPGLTHAAVRRWANVKQRTFSQWIAGMTPDIESYERLLDLLRGRIVPREVGPGRWVFEPADPERWRRAYVALMERMERVISDVRAAVEHPGSEDVPLPHVAEKSGQVLTGTGPGAKVATNTGTGAHMQTHDERYAAETAEQFKAFLYPSQKDRLRRAAERTKQSQGQIVRDALDRYLDESDSS